MSSGDVMTRKKRFVNFEDSKCVWKLECPFCGWLFGFCLDLTGQNTSQATFTANGQRRRPTRYPKVEAGRLFAYFKPRRRICPVCGAKRMHDYEVDEWLRALGIALDYDGLSELLLVIDPDGECCIAGSDKVLDLQSEEWGVDGMPSQYLFVRNETALARIIRSSQSLLSARVRVGRSRLLHPGSSAHLR